MIAAAFALWLALAPAEPLIRPVPVPQSDLELAEWLENVRVVVRRELGPDAERYIMDCPPGSVIARAACHHRRLNTLLRVLELLKEGAK